MSDTEEKAQLVNAMVVYIKGETKEQNRYINLVATLKKEGRTFTVKDRKVTREEWMEAFDLLEAKKATIYINGPRNGGTNAAADTTAPWNA